MSWALVVMVFVWGVLGLIAAARIHRMRRLIVEVDESGVLEFGWVCLDCSSRSWSNKPYGPEEARERARSHELKQPGHRVALLPYGGLVRAMNGVSVLDGGEVPAGDRRGSGEESVSVSDLKEEAELMEGIEGVQESELEEGALVCPCGEGIDHPPGMARHLKAAHNGAYKAYKESGLGLAEWLAMAREEVGGSE